ncbi:hypothetical protein [Micromonospora sp. Llam0]|uniref:hypothetical protein n=1 Tax=Micromonospora sp. Llam0 TaxID=2485143 RepID=UPI0011CE4A7C|nr:hypothetical protein [Micromonospora sp. Llam0]
MVSVVVALLALGWGVYAYYVPRTAPAPAVSVAASPDPVATVSTPSPNTESAPGNSVAETLKTLPAWYERFSRRVERERYEQSWWEIAVAWLLLMGLLVWRTIVYFDRAIWVPVFGLGFIYFFWPSLSWWGVTVSTIGCLIAWAIASLESSGAFAPRLVPDSSDSDEAASDSTHERDEEPHPP